VAKALNMTGQELRRELLQVDFGVKPTDREVSDTLAQGIIRYLARKHNITPQGIPSANVPEEDEEGSLESSSPAPLPSASIQPSPAIRPPVQDLERRAHLGVEHSVSRHDGETGKGSPSMQETTVPVLRKLTLEGIPRPSSVLH
jgi:hypothetical protein